MNVKPTWEREGVRLYCGDALAIIESIDDWSIDAVITDPPYSSGGAFRGDRTQQTTAKYVRGNTAKTDSYAQFTGDTRDSRAYLAWCSLWLGRLLMMSNQKAKACLFTDWRQLPITTDALQCAGWVWRGIGVWDKTEAARPAKGRFRNQCEYIVWGSNGSLGHENSIDDGDDRRCLPGVWRQSVVSMDKVHIAEKPLNVMEGIVEIAGPGDVVVDPFMGSGTTGVACVRLGRKFIGIELDPEHFNTAREKINDELDRAPLFKEQAKEIQSSMFD